MAIEQVFDSNVDRYEEWFEHNPLIFESEAAAIQKLLPAFDKGIEIGVGTGIFASLLGIQDGVEPSKIMGQKARERGIRVIQAKAEDLPIADQAYDLALMVTVDCFLEDIPQAFREVRRILTDDGHFVIAMIDRDAELGQLYCQHKDSNVFYRHANFHSAHEIMELLKQSGFEIIDKKQTIFTLENQRHEIKEGVGEGVFAVIKARKA